jgi:hypothetical protein
MRICICILFLSYSLKAQEDNFRQVVRCVFYNKQVYDKIFFEYESQGITTFMEGYKKGLKGAFMLPDTNVQRQYPGILELVGTSHATEKYFMTMTLLSHPDGNVYASSNILDRGISIWIDFDRILLTKGKAILEFHTTSWSKISSMMDKYVSVECELKRKRRGWKIISLKITPQPCCTRLW